MSEKITTRHSKERRKGKTDWARVLAVSEKELERSIASDRDSDVAGLDWTQARLSMPQRKESVHLRLDPDVLAWYRQQGQGYLTRMNAILRAYMDAHRQH
jgi:uncharacterized protein (DUF4415 family)